MANKQTSTDRKARLEAAKNEQKAKERRTVIVIVAGCAVLLLALGGVITYAIQDARSQTLPGLGVSASAASCGAVTDDDAAGTGQHVGPGTDQPDKNKVTYDTVPPSHGEHFASPAVGDRHWYSAEDRPAVETLVHNLEHGYTILWYDGDAARGKTDLIQDVVAQANRQAAAGDKFLAVEWDSSYGDLPAKTPYALVHWSKASAHRQYCGDLSGAAVDTFITDHPASDTQEPGAA